MSGNSPILVSQYTGTQGMLLSVLTVISKTAEHLFGIRPMAVNAVNPYEFVLGYFPTTVWGPRAP